MNLYSYKVESHSDDTPQSRGGGKTSFYVSFTAHDGTTTPIHYYEVDSEDIDIVKATLAQAASDYNDYIVLTSSSSESIEGLSGEVPFNE